MKNEREFLARGARPIRGLARLESVLALHRDEIRQLAKQAPECYRSFNKRKKSGKTRRIDAPNDLLAKIQRRIKRGLLDPIQFPSGMLGGVRGRSTLQNAQIHAGAVAVLSLDIRDCFPSVTHRQVYRVFNERLGCVPEIARILTQLTTLNGHVPQGAPTSTGLVNLALLDLFESLDEIARANKLTLTMWVDDITFSGERVREIVDAVVDACRRHGFSLKATKKRISSRSRIMEVTGIVINSGTPSTHRQKRKALWHRIASLSVGNESSDAELQAIRGHLSQVRYVNERQALSLERLLTAKVASGHSGQGPGCAGR